MNEGIYNFHTMDLSLVIEIPVKSSHEVCQKTPLTFAYIISDQLSIVFLRMKPYVT